jgi:hypothetical protein
MKTKKNLTLISLMLGAMMLVGAMGMVSAVEVVPPYCNVIVTEPQAGGFYDPVTIAWHLEGNACNPLYYTIQYNTNCDLNSGWKNITTNLDPLYDNMEYDWYSLPVSGQYCIRVNMIGTNCVPGCCSVTGYSGMWNLDLVAPEADYEIVSGPSLACEDEEDCDFYITDATQLRITCDETSEEDWQSQEPYTLYYRWRVDEGSWTGWTSEVSNSNPGVTTPFNFPTDSRHELEYYCGDEVEKESEVETAVFIVESDTPELERTVTGPQEYPEEGCDGCTQYFNKETEMCLNLVNYPEHEIPGITITCNYWYGDVEGDLNFPHGTFTLEDGECFSYTEDSYHSLQCSVTDALENSYTHMPWLDVVDALAPIINVNVGTPQYESDGLYVSDDTKICVSAVDSTPHPVGFVELNCEYDWKNLSEDEWTNMGAITLDEEGCFEFAENSYHKLRCTAVDALDNEAQLSKDFIVDTLAPTLTKEVGNPSHDCNGIWEDVTGKCEESWDWIVTQSTPIYLSCNDVEPHPSNVDELCYRILWEGEIQVQKILEVQDEDGWVCVNPEDYDGGKVPIYFNEECEHTLEFYCVDNVGKTSETDVEVFKVEGTPFEIELDKKWNLISFPFNLLSNNIEEVFDDASENIEGVWSYENGEWKVYIPGVTSGLTEVVPGRGYWVKTTEATTLLVGGELMSEGQMLPPSVNLNEGWNLIGYYGTSTPKQAYCSLFSLVDTQQGFPRWSALWGYDSSSFVPLNSWSYMEAGKGYWIEMDVEDQYSPATTCWGMPLA